jgi:uncharacterized membrane protein YqhA
LRRSLCEFDRVTDRERWPERLLFANRWLLMSFYFDISVFALIAKVTQARAMVESTLTALLILIFIFSGYFAARIDIREDKGRPQWMASIDFSPKFHGIAVSAASQSRLFLPGFRAVGSARRLAQRVP